MKRKKNNTILKLGLIFLVVITGVSLLGNDIITSWFDSFINSDQTNTSICTSSYESSEISAPTTSNIEEEKKMISFYDTDNTLLHQEEYLVGEVPNFELPGDTEIYDYTNWNPELVVVTEDTSYIAERVRQKYEVIWQDNSGNIIQVEELEYGSMPSRALPLNTDQYSYSSWSPEIEVVYNDVTYTTNRVLNKYTITYIDEVSGVVLKEVELDYGSTPNYPLLEDTSEWNYINFNPQVTSVTEDTTYYAHAVKQKYEVTFKDYDGTILDVLELEYGTTPNYDLPNSNLTISYLHWSPSIISVTGDITYTAVVESVKYSVKFVDTNGVLIEEQMLGLGEIPACNLPSDNAEWNYTTWSPTITAVESDIIYTAVRVKQEYQVKFLDTNGVLLDEITYQYGEAPTHDLPSNTEQYNYTTWEPAITAVTKNQVYTAVRSIRSYGVIFNSNGGSSVKPQLVAYGNLINKPPSPTKPNYLFVGWFLDIGLTQGMEFDSYQVTSNITLYGKWQYRIKNYRYINLMRDDNFVIDSTYDFAEYFNEKAGTEIVYASGVYEDSYSQDTPIFEFEDTKYGLRFDITYGSKLDAGDGFAIWLNEEYNRITPILSLHCQQANYMINEIDLYSEYGFDEVEQGHSYFYETIELTSFQNEARFKYLDQGASYIEELEFWLYE